MYVLLQHPEFVRAAVFASLVLLAELRDCLISTVAVLSLPYYDYDLLLLLTSSALVLLT